MLWTVESGQQEWFAGRVLRLASSASGRTVPVVAYDDGECRQLGPCELWRRPCSNAQIACDSGHRSLASSESEDEASYTSDHGRLAAYLRTLGGSKRLIEGWRVTISHGAALSHGAAAAKEGGGAATSGGISGCFISEDGKRFRSFEGVARHLGLFGANSGAGLEPARPYVRLPPSFERPPPAPLNSECRAHGHAFDQPGSRRCCVCHKLVAPLSHSRENATARPERTSAFDGGPPPKVRRQGTPITPYYLACGEAV